MVNIEELKKYQQQYDKNKQYMEMDSVSGFIDFIEKEQSKKGNSVITLEKRETARRLKELKKRQKENKPITPEDDFKNLKD